MDPRDQVLIAALSHPIFKDLGEGELESLFAEGICRTQSYGQGQRIIKAGSPVREAGLVLSGAIHIFRTDYDGRELMIGEAVQGEIFAEVFALLRTEESPVSVVAGSDSEILHIDIDRLSADKRFTSVCNSLLHLMAGKNLYLSRKIEILSKRTIRERLLFYFNTSFNHQRSFSIPFTREELASYIAADRSAVSSELSRMQADGLIEVRGRNITLI